jgi:hypothetical protein
MDASIFDPAWWTGYHVLSIAVIFLLLLWIGKELV